MNRKFLTSVAFGAIMPLAFEPGKAGWKLDADGKVVMSNGNPVYVKEDGSESIIEANTISRLNGEAKANRERAEAAELKAKAFDGLDAAAARDALEKLSKIDQKKLIDAGEIDRVRDEIGKGYQAQIAERDTVNGSLKSRLDKMMLDHAFMSSDFVRDRVAVPPEMFRAFFGNNFKIEDDKIVPYDSSGNKIFSDKRMGEVANVDEAFEKLVMHYPHKDSILKAQNQSGSGNSGGGGARAGSRTMQRSEFDKLPPIKQAEASGLMGKGELSIVD